VREIQPINCCCLRHSASIYEPAKTKQQAVNKRRLTSRKALFLKKKKPILKGWLKWSDCIPLPRRV
jgi:hypothetical protein